MGLHEAGAEAVFARNCFTSRQAAGPCPLCIPWAFECLHSSRTSESGWGRGWTSGRLVELHVSVEVPQLWNSLYRNREGSLQEIILRYGRTFDANSLQEGLACDTKILGRYPWPPFGGKGETGPGTTCRWSTRGFVRSLSSCWCVGTSCHPLLFHIFPCIWWVLTRYLGLDTKRRIYIMNIPLVNSPL